MSRRVIGLALIAMAGVAGCADSATAPGVESSIRAGEQGMRIEPGRHVLTAIGERVQLHVVGLDGDEGDLPAPHMVWQSLDPDVATIDPTGVVEAISNGVARIRVTLNDAGGVELEAEITVRQAAHELLVPESTVLAYVGHPLQLSMDARDARGVPLPPWTMEWFSSAPDIATVDRLGVLTGKRAGKLVVRVSRDDREAAIHVRVEHALVEVEGGIVHR